METLFTKLETFIEAHMPEAKVRAECSNDLLCQRTGARHKAGCPGKTIDITTYARGIQVS